MLNLPELVGIVNLSEDSFSGDGLGTAEPVNKIVRRVEEQIFAGATIIDVGAQSTRPGAEDIEPAVEIDRLRSALPVIVDVCHQSNVKVSLDSHKLATIDFGIECGVDWINDVSGGRSVDIMRLAAKSNVIYAAMHSLTVPADKQVVIEGDPILAVHTWIAELIAKADSVGLQRDKLIIDPGIGFGKTSSQSWQLIQAVAEFLRYGIKLLYGHSRKSFFSEVTDVPFVERDLETHALSCFLAGKGVNYLRVHDVAGSKRALAVWQRVSTR